MAAVVLLVTNGSHGVGRGLGVVEAVLAPREREALVEWGALRSAWAHHPHVLQPVLCPTSALPCV